MKEPPAFLKRPRGYQSSGRQWGANAGAGAVALAEAAGLYGWGQDQDEDQGVPGVKRSAAGNAEGGKPLPKVAGDVVVDIMPNQVNVFARGHSVHKH